MPDDKRTTAGPHLPHKFGFGKYRSQRSISAADPLGADDQIRDHAPMIETPTPAGAPESGHHFVGDKEDPVPIADLTDALEIPWCGWHSAKRSSDHGFGHERGHIVRADLANRVFEVVSTREIALGAGSVRAAAIRVAWRDMLGGRQNRSERPATRRISAERERGDCGAVEG